VLQGPGCGAQFPRGGINQGPGRCLGGGGGEGRRLRRVRGHRVRALEAKKGVMSSYVYNSKRLPFLPFLGYPSSPREESAVWFCFVPHLSPQDLDLLLWPGFERLYSSDEMPLSGSTATSPKTSWRNEFTQPVTSTKTTNYKARPEWRLVKRCCRSILKIIINDLR
jgi:hypothetical protein